MLGAYNDKDTLPRGSVCLFADNKNSRSVKVMLALKVLAVTAVTFSFLSHFAQ